MHTDLDEQYDKIYRYCYMKLRHQQTAEDITQETFLRFLENKTYKDMGKEISYLYRIARNLCIDQIRKQKNEALSEELSGCMENIQERMAVHMDLRKAIKSLDAQEQELVFLTGLLNDDDRADGIRQGASQLWILLEGKELVFVPP